MPRRRKTGTTPSLGKAVLMALSNSERLTATRVHLHAMVYTGNVDLSVADVKAQLDLFVTQGLVQKYVYQREVSNQYRLKVDMEFC